MTRLEELHKAYEERQKQVETQWVFTYNRHPPNGRLVLLWILEDGVNKVGCTGRFNAEDGVWLSADWSWRGWWNVIAWKDIETGE